MTSVLVFGEWRADRESGELTGGGATTRLEPKVMDLLFVLAADAGAVVPRERLLETLWPGLVVGEDTLARTVFKLRQALGDDAKAPRYIETIAKRGYRLVAAIDTVTSASRADRREPVPVSTPAAFVSTQARIAARRHRVAAGLSLLAVLIAIVIAMTLPLRRVPEAPGPSPSADDAPTLVARADDFYFQFSRADNESAIALYERVLGLDPEDPAALAGLANALTQRAVRWPEPASGSAASYTRLGDALAAGHLDRDPARLQLERARHLAERAVHRAPDSAAAHKALGFVRSAQREFDSALHSYERAIALDANAWGAMINVGDVLEIAGRGDEALPWFERAFDAMSREYDRNAAQVRPWHAALGVLIADNHRARGDAPAAEGWYRRVLVQSPLHVGATRGLAALLRASGDAAGADRLCAELSQRIARRNACEAP
jgi:transcriptional activator of cad operon